MPKSQKEAKHKAAKSAGVGILVLLLSIFLMRDLPTLVVLGAIVFLVFSYALCVCPWVAGQPTFMRMSRGVIGVAFIGAACLGLFAELWCRAKQDDPRRDTSKPADIVVDLTFRLPESSPINHSMEAQEVMRNLFCYTDQMRFEAVLVPGEDPLTWSPLTLIVEAVNPQKPCDLRSFVAASDVGGKNTKIETPVVVTAQDSHRVTLEMKVFAYSLDYALRTSRRYTIREYGRAPPIYSNLSQNPLTFGQEEFFLPSGGVVTPSGPALDDNAAKAVRANVEVATQIKDKVEATSFNEIDVSVSPNPAEGMLKSSWVLRPDKVGPKVAIDPFSRRIIMSVDSLLFRGDDECGLSSIFH